jgi:tetratricopeptide (TPR) repeat protein
VALPAPLGQQRFLLGEVLFGAEAWGLALADWHNAHHGGAVLLKPSAGRSTLDPGRQAECDAAPRPAAPPALPGRGLALVASVLRRTGLRRGGAVESLRLLRGGFSTLLPVVRVPVPRPRPRRVPAVGLLAVVMAGGLWPQASGALADEPLRPRVVLEAYETRAARDGQRECFATLTDEAVPVCERALALGLTAGKASGVARRLAALHARGLRWEKAARAWGAVAAILPRDPAPRVAQANVLSLLGRQDQALALFEEALRLAPGDAEALLGAGTALARLGRTHEALARIQEAAQREPDLLERRPALAALVDALRAGKPWP